MVKYDDFLGIMVISRWSLTTVHHAWASRDVEVGFYKLRLSYFHVKCYIDCVLIVHWLCKDMIKWC